MSGSEDYNEQKIIISKLPDNLENPQSNKLKQLPIILEKEENANENNMKNYLDFQNDNNVNMIMSSIHSTKQPLPSLYEYNKMQKKNNKYSSLQFNKSSKLNNNSLKKNNNDEKNKEESFQEEQDEERMKKFKPYPKCLAFFSFLINLCIPGLGTAIGTCGMNEKVDMVYYILYGLFQLLSTIVLVGWCLALYTSFLYISASYSGQSFEYYIKMSKNRNKKTNEDNENNKADKSNIENNSIVHILGKEDDKKSNIDCISVRSDKDDNATLNLIKERSGSFNRYRNNDNLNDIIKEESYDDNENNKNKNNKNL